MPDANIVDIAYNSDHATDDKYVPAPAPASVKKQNTSSSNKKSATTVSKILKRRSMQLKDSNDSDDDNVDPKSRPISQISKLMTAFGIGKQSGLCKHLTSVLERTSIDMWTSDKDLSGTTLLPVLKLY